MKIEFYIPVKPAEPKHRLIRKLITRFGGLTQIPAKGHWVDDEGSCINEPVEILQVFHYCPTLNTQSIMVELAMMAGEYKDLAKQQAVLYVVDGQDYML